LELRDLVTTALSPGNHGFIESLSPDSKWRVGEDKFLYNCAEYTMENSWWWAEKLPETCRVIYQNKFGN